jgi:MYXO-CTERM domain-containing protein
MSNLGKRMNAHFAACAAVAGAAMAGGVQQSDAAIVWSGIVNINIPATTNGLYLNVVTGQINEPGNTGGSSVPGWDINPWGGSGFGLFSPTGGGYLNLGSNQFNLPFNTTIGPGGTFGGLGTTTNNAQWNLNSTDNLVGFRFVNEANANQVHYGWFRVGFDSTISSRRVVEYAYEDQAGVGIGAGVIPAPGALALLGLAGLVGTRRRRA